MSDTPGTLSATQEGSRVRLVFEFPDGFDYCWTAERFEGLDADDAEVWVPPPGCKYVKTSTAYDDTVPEGHTPTYRALAYRQLDPINQPNFLHTGGVYTALVSP